MVAREPDRLSVSLWVTRGLPYNPDVSQDVIDEVKRFRASDEKLTDSPCRQIMKVDEVQHRVKFYVLAEILLGCEDLPIGFVASHGNGISKPVPYVAELPVCENGQEQFRLALSHGRSESVRCAISHR